MAQSGKVAIGLFVLRDREHLVMLKPEGRAIMLLQLRFAATIRDSAGLDLPGKVEVPKAQMELALELVKKFGGAFKPEAFKDTYAASLRAIIAAKAKGRALHFRKEEAPRETEVEDILSKLKQSLSATVH
jgi:DNA end-binding protein Ku